jgi:hypothetical protein
MVLLAPVVTVVEDTDDCGEVPYDDALIERPPQAQREVFVPVAELSVECALATTITKPAIGKCVALYVIPPLRADVVVDELGDVVGAWWRRLTAWRRRALEPVQAARGPVHQNLWMQPVHQTWSR